MPQVDLAYWSESRPSRRWLRRLRSVLAPLAIVAGVIALQRAAPKVWERCVVLDAQRSLSRWSVPAARPVYEERCADTTSDPRDPLHSIVVDGGELGMCRVVPPPSWPTLRDAIQANEPRLPPGGYFRSSMPEAVIFAAYLTSKSGVRRLVVVGTDSPTADSSLSFCPPLTAVVIDPATFFQGPTKIDHALIGSVHRSDDTPQRKVMFFQGRLMADDPARFEIPAQVDCRNVTIVGRLMDDGDSIVLEPADFIHPPLTGSPN